MNRNLIGRGLSFITFLALFLALTMGQSWAKPPYQVVGYCYVGTKASTTSLTGDSGNINWSTDIPWQDLTVVADAFMIPNTNKTFSNGGAKNAALVNAAHANGTRCIVSLGGGGQDGSFPTLCQSANRAAFASAVTALVMQYGYDGVDIDWEAPNSAPQADATAMMQAIYQAVKALPNSSVDGQPRTLSFATVDYVSNIYNMTTLGNYTDWAFYMGYDWYDCPNLYNGPLNLEKNGIGNVTNGSQWSYPIGKVILGCPLYTNDYNTSNCTAAEYSTLGILHLGTPGAYNSTWAEQAYTAPNGHTVYVDTAQSYTDKTKWAQSAGLKGIGMWDVGLALPYTDSAVAGIWNVIGGSGSGPTATPTKTATPVVASTWRVKAGGSAYTDSLGHVWAADENFNGGIAANTTNAITGALPAAADQALYQTERYGNPVSYSFNVPAGNYQVTLKFAETYWTAAGQRVFNASINGTQVLTNFDIFSAAGGMNKAVDKVFTNIAPTGGVITIQLGPASADNAKVDAIEIIPQAGSPTATLTRTNTPVPPTATFTVTSTPTPLTLSTWRIKAGGAQVTDSQGNVWSADSQFTGGTPATVTTAITGALPASSDQALYQTERYGNPFTYAFHVPAGNYQVTLKFAETYWTASGQRVFNTSINGATVLTNFDLFASAGGAGKAIDRVFGNIAPVNGLITIQMGPASVDNAKVDAIQIIPMPSTPTPTRTNTPVPPTSTFTAVPPTSTFTAVNTATFTNTPVPPTSTFTAVPPTATNTAVNTDTPVNTNTPAPPTNTPAPPTVTETPVPPTLTNTPVPATATNTPVPPTSTFTAVNTNTPTNTAVPPTVTNTPVPPTATNTPVPPTATFTPTKTHTPLPPTNTPTRTPVPPTKTPTPSSACAGVAAWSPNNVHYAIGAKVTYNNRLYQCIQAHNSLSTWTPPATQALWQDLGGC